jgi:hypothetical protein
LKTAKIPGTENAKIQISKSTSITEISASPFAESAGAPSLKRTLNGKKIRSFFGGCLNKRMLVVSQNGHIFEFLFG